MLQSVNLTVDELKFLNGGGEVDCPILECCGRVRPINSRCVQLSEGYYEIEIIYRCLRCREIGGAIYVFKN